jgi:hypothetical protein
VCEVPVEVPGLVTVEVFDDEFDCVVVWVVCVSDVSAATVSVAELDWLVVNANTAVTAPVATVAPAKIPARVCRAFDTAGVVAISSSR